MSDSKVKELGMLSDKLLVFGGVYSNLQALEAVFAEVQRRGLSKEQVICTGDLVAYCAEPEACVQFVREWGIHVIAGNVELNIRDEADDCGCNFNEGSRCDLLSQQWFPFVQENLSKSSRAYIKTLPEFLRFQMGSKSAFVLHGSYHNTSEFIFESSDYAIKEKNFKDSHSDLIIAGHCGLPFITKEKSKIWFNPGVIGMPANDGTPRVWYGTLKALKNGEIETQIQPLSYENREAAAAMRKNNLPQSYAETLETGIWDNCEILPKEETSQQGKALSF